MGSQSFNFPYRAIVVVAWLTLAGWLPVRLAAQGTVSALAVPLLLPSAVVFDAQGNLFVAETGNHVIRRIDPSGNITTVAGTGVQGFAGDGGLATAAQMDSPQGLAIDVTGNLYIADTHNHRIRKIDTATQIISTVAGTGVVGFSGDGGLAAAAQLDLPTALAVDTSGDLYFADSANHRIRRIDAISDRMSTVIGNGTQGFSGDDGLAIAAAIDSPAGLAVDSAGNIYLADTHNQRIRRIDAATQTITTSAGSGAFGFSGDGSAVTALALPQGLSLDSADNLYLADRANHRIRRIDAVTGQISTVAGNGVQGFSGDGGAAIAASLDSPRSATLSNTNAAGLVTLADTGNQRIRQLQSAPAASTLIETVGGLGQTVPGVLTLSASSVIVYGTGSITASLVGGTAATGSIILFDTTASGTVTLATIALNGGPIIFNTSKLQAGQHSIVATYSGDASHSAAQSTAIALTISPQPLQVIAAAATVLYGAPIPTVGGSVIGLLPQDAGAVAVTFSTTAALLAPAGAYPITATISGPAAGNYAFSSTPAILTINLAPSVTTLTESAASIAAGSPVTVSIHVASTTSGTPAGAVSLVDANAPVASGAIDGSGNATFSNSTFSTGSHSLTAVYSGNGNFSGSTSVPVSLTVTDGSAATPDFTFAATGVTNEDVVSGSPASFTFAAQMLGNLSSAINLTIAGLPVGATASFSPAYIPPGAANQAVTLTIATAGAQAQSRLAAPAAVALLLIPLVGLTRRRGLCLFGLVMLLALGSVTGCGDRINNGASSTSPIKSYAITVTGTATAPTGAILSHSAVVTLGVQSSQ
jgi:sugar lactone lactonase YvrE